MARSEQASRGSEVTVPARRSTHAGFTLLEMVTAAVIVGIVMAFSLPKLASYYRQTTVRSARDQFVAKHALARATAIRFGRVAEFHIDAANDRFWVTVDTSAAATGVIDTIGQMADYSDSPVAITANRSILCFDYRGLATTYPASCDKPDVKAYFETSGYNEKVTVTIPSNRGMA